MPIPSIAPLADVTIDTSDSEAVDTSQDGVISVPLPDGSVVVDLRPKQEDKSADKFDENLALKMEAGELGAIANTLLEGIEADIQSRSEWEQTRSRGIDFLGLKIEDPRSDAGTSSAPLESQSRVRHPLLCEALIRFWANACGELFPADGPVKIKNDGMETASEDDISEAYCKDFNHFLTVTSSEYYPDSKRNIFWTGFGGCGFKKVYHHPLKRRPVSETVDANDIIASNSAPDIANCGRVTHRIIMRPSVVMRMQQLKVYRDCDLGQPAPTPNAVDQKKENVEGIRSRQDRPEDQPYTIYECYCEYDLPEYAPGKFKGEGIPLPYRVTIDKDSRQILEVRRNWNEDDPECLAKEYLVKFPFIDAFGLYGIGLVHILGNSTNALTAAWREMLDAGMFANFPAFLYLRAAGRQLTNEFRAGPGSGVGLDSPTGRIQDVAAPFPYKDVSPGLLGLVDKITEATQRLGGTADLPVGEGKQDAPVGTTLALIEQATKVESAVHKGLHTAMAKEFQLLRERLKEDPEAFWRGNDDCATEWNKEKLLHALDNCKLVPVADPNTPSHMHRIAKALAIKQLQAANPQLYDARAVDTRILKMIKVDDAESLFNNVQAAPQGPDANQTAADAKMITAQTGAMKVHADLQSKDAELKEKAAARQSDEAIAATNLAKEIVIHRDDHGLAQQQHGLAAQQAGMSAHQASQQHGLNVQQAAQDHSLARAQHGLDLRQHGLESMKAAHDAAMDVHQVMNPPKPAKGGQS